MTNFLSDWFALISFYIKRRLKSIKVIGLAIIKARFMTVNKVTLCHHDLYKMRPN